MRLMPVRFLVWLLTLAIAPIPLAVVPLSFRIEVIAPYVANDEPCINSVALPPGSDELHTSQVSVTEQVLSYLEEAEKKEIDPWLRDDVRIAWITTLEASRGNQRAHAEATERVLGLHPDKVWPAIVERRKAKLGREYDRLYDAAGNLRADGGKKPCVSVNFSGEVRVRVVA